jgi:hypothetical protein
MSFDLERLYGLLPVMYRLRDAQQGEPLKALLSVIAEQVAVLEEDLAQLYDDQFIETCADWAVPYIGDLIGYRTLYSVTGAAHKVSNPRAEVANTIAYRRRKGTAAVLEQLAHDVSGWPARVVEFFQLLATTQYLNHVRPQQRGTPDLRRWTTLQQLDTPFDGLAHTLDVRRIASGRGRYNIPHIGLFLWRLHAYPITQGTARPVAALDGCYTFHPLGFDLPLFNRPQTETEITHIAEPINVPEPLHRRPLYIELEARRQALADGTTGAPSNGYFSPTPVLHVFKDGVAIPAAEVLICDLSEYTRPPAQKSYRLSTKPADSVEPDPELPIQVAVDPVLGRLALAQGVLPPDLKVTVSYAYGFSADLGGGEYDRPDLPAPTVTVEPGNDGLNDALAAIGTNTAEAIIELNTSATHSGDLTITLGVAHRLTLQAKEKTRPVLDGALTIVAADGAELLLDGLLIASRIEVRRRCA